MEFIKAENLTFEYTKETDNGLSKTVAIDNISFTVEKGSFTAVIGQNGSGKSTLAKNINALLTPTGGRIEAAGMDTSVPENLWDIRRRIAMVFQNPDNQIVSSIVEDDVAFGPENLGVDPEEIRSRVNFALKGVEMYEYRKKGPHNLSGGQKQRVAIAGAIAMEPECIVFDEPTAMLDPKGRRDVLEAVHALNDRGITVILITHFMEEALCADKIIVMDRGVIAMEGTPREVFRRADELKALSLGVPAAVELGIELRKRGIDVPEDIMTTEEIVDYVSSLTGKGR